MGQETKILSKEAFLLKKIQKRSSYNEENKKIKKWVEVLKSDCIKIEKKSCQQQVLDDIASQQALDQVVESILRDFIKE